MGRSHPQDHRHPHRPDDVNSSAFSPDGKTFATASLDDTARLWRIHA
ncbi:hypothetical protein [Plantactinospora mayteni]|nr:hypothetical protein [Plantactinospora mayteni]